MLRAMLEERIKGMSNKVAELSEAVLWGDYGAKRMSNNEVIRRKTVCMGRRKKRGMSPIAERLCLNYDD